MQSKFIRPKKAAEKLGISTSHLYNLIARNEFPKQIKLSKGISVFREIDIDEWMVERADATTQERQRWVSEP